LGTLRKRIRQIKENLPIYREILDFYEKVREEQEKIKGSLRIEPVPLNQEWKVLLTQEGTPLLRKEDFPMDVEAGAQLFQSLCTIARDANPFMSEQMKEIEEAIKGGKFDVNEILRQKPKDEEIERVAEELGLDRKVFLFLIQNSAKPSIEAGMRQISKELASQPWFKGICPICGSLPLLSLLREEAGKRSLLCSFCGYEWRMGRLLCPFCNNKEQGSLRYLYAEEGGACRIDLCEECHHYIKTIDLRKADIPDPSLEDLATLHLDIVAHQRGYERPVATLFF